MALKKLLIKFRDIFWNTQCKAYFISAMTLTSIFITATAICRFLDIYPKILDHWLVTGCIASMIAFLSWSISQIYTTWSQSKQPHVNLLTNENPLSLAEARISSFNKDIRELKQDREKEIDKLNDLRHQNNNQNGEEFNLLIQKTEKRIEQIDITLEYYSEQMTECLKTRMQPNKI